MLRRATKTEGRVIGMRKCEIENREREREISNITLVENLRG